MKVKAEPRNLSNRGSWKNKHFEMKRALKVMKPKTLPGQQSPCATLGPKDPTDCY